VASIIGAAHGAAALHEDIDITSRIEDLVVSHLHAHPVDRISCQNAKPQWNSRDRVSAECFDLELSSPVSLQQVRALFRRELVLTALHLSGNRRRIPRPRPDQV
jgi:hypothetical protein